jgi:hypothetical protein
MTEDTFVDILTEDYDKFLLTLLIDASLISDKRHCDILNKEYQVSVATFQKIKPIVIEALTTFICDNFNTEKMESFNSYRKSIASLLVQQWKFREAHESFIDIARCMCLSTSSHETVTNIRDLICDRSGTGFITQWQDFNEKMASNIYLYSRVELWFITYLFSEEGMSLSTAEQQLKTLVKELI